MSEIITQPVTSDFIKFADPVHKRYEEMAKGELFTVDIEDIAAEYLAAFPEGANQIYKERTEHDCSTCKQFIRNLGKVVGLSPEGDVLTVWDDHENLQYPYNVVAEKLQQLVRGAPIVSVFRTKERQYGCSHNYGPDGQRFNHFHGKVKDRHHSLSPGSDRSEVDARVQVLRRGLEELRPVDFETVLDLIDSNSLYRGAEHRDAVAGFQELQKQYLESDNKETFPFLHMKNRAARIRNTAIGTLLIDLSNGVDIESAVKKFESVVAPANYKRPTAIITSRMVEDAVAKLDELGLEQAIERRCARLDDVHVNDVLFVSREAVPKMRGGVADLLASEVKDKPINLNGATEITGEEFFASVVPQSKSISVLFENKHLGNLVSLTAPVHESTGRLFKWDNDFAWSYDGDVADATIKQRVKAAGGKVDALFRASLAWSNTDDLDLHIKTPSGGHIYFGNKHDHETGGQLDIDMNAGSPYRRDPVENVYFNKRHRLTDGVYLVQVHNYTKRESVDVGFTLEIEFDGVQAHYFHSRAVPNNATIDAIKVHVRGGRLEQIEACTSGNDKSQSVVSGRDIPVDRWSLQTGQLVPVDTLMLSPNHWGDQSVGNKHYLFMLRGCKNPDPVRGIYNEFLRSDLEKHHKVFEVLGAKSKAQPSDDGLSGLGFSSTRKDEVTVVADGRPYQIKF